MEIREFLNQFGEWIESSYDFKNSMDKKVNEKVFSKTSKIQKKIILDVGNSLEEVSKDFLKFGGNVLKQENEMILIEVKSGTFYLNKKYVY